MSDNIWLVIRAALILALALCLVGTIYGVKELQAGGEWPYYLTLSLSVLGGWLIGKIWGAGS